MKILGWTSFIVCLPFLICMYVLSVVGAWSNDIFRQFYDPIYEWMGNPFDRY